MKIKLEDILSLKKQVSNKQLMYTATVDNSSLEYSSIAMANLAVRRAAAAIADTILRLRLTNTNATASEVKPPSL